eukprot:TRINITY_DN68913_c0_g1_i1.p1 TRINITY_DN68913_c0_g1~~TRINITY_DN68913_c0_g1_i1.p1  ORF type:complete len:240 (-),score=21.89 TRINITY_DN68913_c0_g1_i1:81-800(-)
MMPDEFVVYLVALGLFSATLQGCVAFPESTCSGPVQQSLKFGVAHDRSEAETICCHNTFFAEFSGYFTTVGGRGLFAQLNASGVTTFYDAVCGQPLFRAPVGRSFQEWQEESLEHGWPSFRSREVISENIHQFSFGEVRSVCGTHLGHNIPDDKGDRYCIDLMCIAGHPTKVHLENTNAALISLAQFLQQTHTWVVGRMSGVYGGIVLQCFVAVFCMSRVVSRRAGATDAAQPLLADTN